MGKRQEIRIIDAPSFVIVPSGLVNCPLVTRRVEKPCGFTAISLAPDRDTTWLGKGKFPRES